MAFTYADVIRRANTALQDEGSVRWTPIELKDNIDQALIDIHAAKPNAKVSTVNIPLVAGIEQSLPAQYSSIIAFTRNNTAGNRSTVRMLPSLDSLSNWMPGWSNSNILQNSATVNYVYQDPLTPRRFTVIPGSTGTGVLEAIVTVAPSPGAYPPVVDRLEVNAYTAMVDLPDQYQTAVLHLTLYRAYLKDGDNAASAQMAMGHHEKAMKVIADLIAADTISAGARAMPIRR